MSDTYRIERMQAGATISTPISGEHHLPEMLAIRRYYELADRMSDPDSRPVYIIREKDGVSMAIRPPESPDEPHRLVEIVTP